MRPFDLEAAKCGDPIVTRDGEAVRFLLHVPEARDDSRVVFLVEDGGILLACDENGSFNGKGRHQSVRDLFMAPKKRTVWVNLYANHDASWHATEECANHCTAHTRIGGKAWPVEIEE